MRRFCSLGAWGLAAMLCASPTQGQLSYDVALQVEDTTELATLEILENGVLLPTPLAIEAPRLPVTLYIDFAGSRDRNVRQWASRIAESAEDLAAQGNFEVVVADPVPQILVRRGSDAQRLRDAMNGLISRQGDRDVLAGIRSSSLGVEEQEGAVDVEALRQAQSSEVAVRRLQADRLLLWMASEGRLESPSMLLLLADNLGLSMWDRYPDKLPPNSLASAREIAEAAAAFGWTLSPFTG